MKLISNLREYKRNYSVSEWGSVRLSILYGFLKDTYLIDPNDIINWLINPGKIVSYDGDLISIYFDENNKRFELSDMYFQGDNEDDNQLIINQEELIRITIRWSKLIQQKPDEIIITQNEDGTLTLIGKFVDGRKI